MICKLMLVIVVLIIINIGSFIRLQIFQNSITSKEFKVFMIIMNVAYLIFVILYLIGIINIK